MKVIKIESKEKQTIKIINYFIKGKNKIYNIIFILVIIYFQNNFEKQNRKGYFKAIYRTNYNNEKVLLINKEYSNHIKELCIDAKKVNPSHSFFFSRKGNHYVRATFDSKNIKNPCIYGENLSKMFENCISLTIMHFYKIINPNTINISFMFSNCSSLKRIHFSGIETFNIKDMTGLFYSCSSLTSIDLSLFNTSNVISMKNMFAGCSSISHINLKLLEFPKVLDMSYMFKNCSKLTSFELSILDIENKINKEGILLGCNSLFPIKYDVCIIGYWFGTNYGSLATYYALHQVIKNLGYSILMIDSPIEPKRKSKYEKCHPITIGRELYNISQRPINKLYKFNEECEIFLVGSDQLWKTNLSRPFKQFFFLDFVENNTKKISYGTSFGGPYKGTDKEKSITKKNLNRFNVISVRDKLSVNIIKHTFDIKNVFQVCDPTFICNYSEYEKLVNNSKIIYNEEFILAYVLDPTEEKGHRLERLSTERNISVIIILDEFQLDWEKNKKNLYLTGMGKVSVKEKVDLNDFMWYFKHSKAIFTDSFHGTIFSIIFQKPFITLRNIERGGERFSSLLDPIDLSYRLFENPSCINDLYNLYETINYTIPYQKLNAIKKFSYEFLKNSLKR